MFTLITPLYQALISHKMLPQSLFLSLFFTLISYPLCSSSFQDDPLANFLERTPGYDPSAYPSFFGTSDKDQADDFEASFSNLQVEYGAEIGESLRHDHLGTPATSLGEVNVKNFGAKGDGETDDTEAFKKAWEETCSSDPAVLVVPEDKKYHVKPITFSGPCKSDSVMLKILGTIEASEDPSDYGSDRSHWLLFYNIKNLQVEGQGTIEGNGNIWWKNSCKIDTTQPCTKAPTAVSFVQCDNLKVYGLKVQNAQEMHVSIQQSVNVEVSKIIVTSPETSPNTDGIHVTSSENVQIIDPVIQTGDDCISINESKNVEVIGVTCGPGHGISIGVLEGGNSEAQVSNVLVDNAKLVGTTNGVRINTWQGGSGYVDNIVFQNIKMKTVSNPIIIDQNYCDQETSCNEQNSAVQIRNIVYKNITGTSATEMTTIFNCSKTLPCQGIVLKDINLEYKTN